MLSGKRIHGFWAAAVLLAAGCATSSSSRDAEPPELPFHVALAPIAVLADRGGGAPPGEDSFEVALDPEQVTAALLETLRNRHFTRVSLLPWPEGFDAAGLAALEPEARQGLWLQGALEGSRYDLLLTGRVTYDPVVRRRSPSGPAFLSAMAWFFTGPFFAFVDDHEYDVRAYLEGTLYDLEALRSSDRSARSGAVRDFLAHFDPVMLDFNQRSEGGKDVVRSVVVPPAYLATATEPIARRLELELADQFASAVALDIRTHADEIVLPRLPARFYLESAGAVARRRPDGSLQISGSIQLENAEDSAADLASWRVTSGGRAWEGAFEIAPRAIEASAAAPTPLPVLSFDLELVLGDTDPEADTVRLIITDDAGRSRSFTLPVAGSSGDPTEIDAR